MTELILPGRDGAIRGQMSATDVRGRLPRPSYPRGGPEFWIDEAIWGHRLYDDQSPWLTLLECFGVAHAEHRVGRAFAEPENGGLTYTPLVQLRLRNILFNSPHISVIGERGGDDHACWSAWLEEIRGSAGGLVEPDFSYLREHFQSFRDFAAVVDFLRSSTIEGLNNKRWSSQFLFPFGPSALYEDLNVSKATYTLDRRFFARTGEILYLMLARSGYGKEIAAALEERLFAGSHPYARLVSVLQGDDQESQNPKTGAYLPYADLPDYASLGADWAAILGRSLPGYDALPHLATISALHLLLYFLRRAQEQVGEAPRPRLVVEIVSPRKTVVRDLSGDSYAYNNLLPQRALGAYINQVRELPAWQDVERSPDPLLKAREVMNHHFGWPQPERDDDDVQECRTVDSLLEMMQKRALVRHRAHLGKIHGVWGRAVGLSSRRASRRTRYAPTDALLKTLVICCVDGRMEFHDFLAILHEKYGLVIGSREAQTCSLVQGADAEAFDDNAERLEERLSSLGLVRRLSDQCAYVENPFANGRSA